MHCKVIRTDEHSFAIVCGARRKAIAPCVHCPALSTKLCDGKKGFGGKKTCDLALCDGCAISIGPDKDLCHTCFREKTMNTSPKVEGLHHVPGFLGEGEIEGLTEFARKVCTEAPLRRPTMPDGTPLKLRLTNAGDFGWWSDSPLGYRYVMKHPTTGKAWPAIPAAIKMLAHRALAQCGLEPFEIENCLINHYAQGDSLGLHIDKTEDDKTAPIISLSIGADAEYLIGGREREDKTESFCVRSGDLVVQSGPSRMYFHGVKRIFPTMGNPLKDGGRLNFTMRKVTRSAPVVGLQVPASASAIDEPQLCAAGCHNPVWGGGVCEDCVMKVHGDAATIQPARG
jgi:alkylated DNA repair protein (DNA oxidative demethylase)